MLAQPPGPPPPPPLSPAPGHVCVQKGRACSPGFRPQTPLPTPGAAHKCPLSRVCPGGENIWSVTVTCQCAKNSPPRVACNGRNSGRRAHQGASGGHRSQFPWPFPPPHRQQTSDGDITALNSFTCPWLRHYLTEHPAQPASLRSRASHCTDGKTEARRGDVTCAPGQVLS